MENNRPKHAFLMIDYEMPEIIKDLHNKITTMTIIGGAVETQA